MVIEESRIEFEFPDGCKTVKFDDELFYREYFNVFPGSKAVDFIELGKGFVALIEVKNCLGDEGNCRWRTFPDNKKKDTSKTTVDVSGRESLDIEIPKKVAMTLAALSGAASFDENKVSLQEIKGFAMETLHNYFSMERVRKHVILFLEGHFECHTRSKKMIMKDLQSSMRRKLKWLNCQVSVVDSGTYNPEIFKINLKKHSAI